MNAVIDEDLHRSFGVILSELGFTIFDIRDHVLRDLCRRQAAARRLPPGHDSGPDGREQRFRAGDCGRGGGLRHQFRTSLCGRHRASGGGAGVDQPGECGALVEA